MDEARHVLVVYCHPCPESFTSAIRDTVCAALAAEGVTVDVLDLYAEGFDPVMQPAERRGYHDEGPNLDPVRSYAERVARADGLVFVYPTWWFGLPAMLKGWLDRVLVPGFAFVLRPTGIPLPGLDHIRHIGVFTSGGATWTTTVLMGAPGRRTLLRALRANCHLRARTLHRAIYRVDTASAADRSAFLASIPAAVAQLMRPVGGPSLRASAPVSAARRVLAERRGGIDPRDALSRPATRTDEPNAETAHGARQPGDWPAV